MASVRTVEKVWTFADHEQLPDDGHRYDILEGKLFMHNVPVPNHGVVLTELFILLAAAQEAGYGEVYTSTSAVALDYQVRGDASLYVSHPDLFFVRQERAASLRGRRGWEGPPDLVVEVLSPTTLREHHRGGRLWRAYEQHGVPHYWLADAEQRTIHQYTLEGEPYQSGHYGPPVILSPGDTLTSPLFPTISVPVDKVFRRVRDDD